MAADQKKTERQSTANVLWENVKQIGLAIILALFIKTSVVEAYKIPSASMEDTLLIGDFLLANKFVYGARLPLVNWRLPSFRNPERGDVVIFIFPGDGVTKYIKRCVAIPGDTVVVRNKALYINGKRFADESFTKFIDTTRDGRPNVLQRKPGGQNSRDFFGPYIVPPDSYFMMGDNRDNSYDSRFWYAVNKDLILGKALMVHWSWNESQLPSPEVSISDPLSVPRLFAFNVAHFFQKVRWNRLFNVIS
jgi:signal peptidase I